MTLVDILIIVLLAATIFRGLETGFIRQASSLIGLVAGLALGIGLATLINGSNTVSVLIVVLSIVGCVAGSEFFGVWLKRAIHWRPVHRADQALGGLMGALSCLVLVWFGSALLSGVQSPTLQRDIRDARIIMWLDDNLPPITDVVAQLNNLFTGISLPGLDITSGEPALPIDDTPLPPLTDFSEIIAGSTAAMTRIEGRSCTGLGTGSGFVIEPGIIVTNAHVVAGMIKPYIKDSNGNRHDARVIGFDPALDIAVLQTDSSLTTSLSMRDDRVAIGTDGVVLGFPGGGPLNAGTAVVVERFRALGTDIYGGNAEPRDVYALKAVVREGNSGGPLLNRDGEVIGVIFARSVSQDSVGYALTMPPVVDVIEGALTSPSAGDSARCAVS